MKVALVFDGLGFGGIERVGIDYVQLFQNLGYEVDIYNLKPEANEMERALPEGCNIYHYKLGYSAIPDYYMLMVKRYRWGKYVYPFAYLGISAVMYGKRLFRGKRKKYDLAIAFSGHMRDLTFVAYDFIRANKKMAWLHGALIEYMASSCTYGDMYQRIKNLCVLSTDMQDLALQVNQYLADLSIHQIYNPISDEKGELDEAFCEELKNKHGEFILMVGRFEIDKDQKTVIKARRVLEDLYGKTPQVVFVGGGSTLEDCKQYAQELKLENVITFYGARQDVQNFYNTASVFVHSSPAEGLPTVLLEAMKYGVPIVATDSPPGVTEILKSDLYGLRCEVCNAESMAIAMNRMLEDKAYRDYYIAQGKNRLTDFSYSTIQNQLRDMISNLL